MPRPKPTPSRKRTATSPLQNERNKKCAVPKTTAQYVLRDRKGFQCLEYEEDVPIPALGEFDVLVAIQFVSLNYRDLGVANGGYPFPVELPRVPCSDGAGIVLAIGPKVTEFAVDDNVCTLFNQAHQSGPLTPKVMGSGLGALLDGTMREFGIFPESGLVHMPCALDYRQASTLPCAALTAWNALFGLESKGLKPGQYVLVQGTGGVACFAAQFAIAAGAHVVVTTSSDDKGAKLIRQYKKNPNPDNLDVIHPIQIVNYRRVKNWGEHAKTLTPNMEGFDHIIEIGGPNTMAQSMKAIKMEGVINVIGFVGGTDKTLEQPGILDALSNMCTVRGLFVGSKAQFQDMNRAIQANGIIPFIDKAFEFKDAKKAYERMDSQKHLGKVVIQVCGKIFNEHKKESADA